MYWIRVLIIFPPIGTFISEICPLSLQIFSPWSITDTSVLVVNDRLCVGNKTNKKSLM